MMSIGVQRIQELQRRKMLHKSIMLSCYQNYTSKGSHCGKYDGKEADNLPRSSKGMRSFSKRTKPDMFDKIIGYCNPLKKQKRCDHCKNFDPSSAGKHLETSTNSR